MASNQDTDGIVRVLRTVFEEYGFTWDGGNYMADIYDVEKHYLSLGNLFWVSEGENGINGTVGLELFPRLEGEPGEIQVFGGRVRVGGCDCSLERLYVHPEARRQGIGTRLSQHCIEHARGLGRAQMEMWSDKHFGDAHRLYKSLGAKVVGERICDDPDESPEWGLWLALE